MNDSNGPRTEQQQVGLDPSYHMIGIGGHGMSVVAELLQVQGARVSGSDRDDSETLHLLQGMGIDAYTPHGAKEFDVDATVVLSSAIKPGNVELIAARERGQKIIHRSQALALAARDQSFVAVAGTHGKTTSSAMIAVALLEAGMDPSFAIGSSIDGVGTGARSGTEVFIAEADESDRSFLNYSPQIELITNIEPDHLDSFGTAEAFYDIFRQFADRIVSGGSLVCCAEDRGSVELALKMRAREDITILTYGRPECSLVEPDVSILNAEVGTEGTVATLRYREVDTSLELVATGEHNLVNAAGAWACCLSLGVAPEVAAKGLAAFRGTERRFEVCGVDQGRTLIDDFAHHPTEVATALRQARLVAGDNNVIVVFQPHLYSRTKFFKQEFADALAIADTAVVADIDGAREDASQGVGITSDLIVDLAPDGANLILGGPAVNAARTGADLTGAGDLCILMGCGNIYLQEPTVLKRWAETPLDTDDK
ncbi:UDP-N-acetylmuramate--L-alanine ligase [Actinomycetaceae bacterium MB13-C1-2]|nr:UDP-N-acetylmuramate--L-alanine ligase [Actinomycetaceae bacterium MB13-C1-2]